MKPEDHDLRYIWHPCSQMKDYETLPPIIIDHAKGLYLYDIHGKRYADVISSWWCNLLGHCHERISQSVKMQLDKLEHVIFANFSHEPAITLCDRLSRLLPAGLSKFFFTDNGSSAIEAALKMSFQYHHQSGSPQKKRFMALSGAYHGETLGALSVSGVDLYSQIYQPLLLDIIRVEGPDCYRCRYGRQREDCAAECFDIAAKSFEQFGGEVCAFIVEPLLQGAAGMKIYPPQYLKRLRQACDAYQIHLIADEIATGFGRTGTMFACEHAAISPDMICLSKGLTGGYLPMALLVTTPAIYDAFYADHRDGKAFMHSHTYSGNPLACAAANAVLTVLEEDGILATAQENARFFQELIRENLSTHPQVGDIRSIGLINAIELVQDKVEKRPFDHSRRTGYQIYREALAQGLVLRPLGDILYFNPPLNISREEMAVIVQTCVKCIRAVLK